MLPGLPPPPNARGEPRPPAAPRVAGPWQGRYQVHAHHFTEAEGDEAEGARVAERTGREPLLEAASARRPDRWRYTATGVFGSLVPIAVLMSALNVFGGAGDRRAAFTITGAVLGGAWLLLTLIHGLREDHIAVQAGARTLYEPDIDNGGPEVSLYELTAVKVVDRARLGLCLRLVQGDRRFVVPCGLLEGNQRLWDLVYLGIRHAVAAGAEADERTRRLLALPLAGKGQG